MWPLVSAENPLKALDPCHDDRAIFFGNGIEKRFASLDDVLTAWYSEWGHGRIFKVFASFPHMQLRVIAHALWSGNLSVLTLLPVEMLREVPSRMVDFAAFSGNTSVLKYLHDGVGLNISTRVAMYNAAQCGHLDVVRYLYELNTVTNVGRAALEAAFHGHLGVVEFFHVHCASCSVEDAFLPAIFRQDLVVSQCILNLIGKDALDEPRPMDIAASYGLMESLQWLHQRGFTCSTDAMDRAAGRGHLDVVQWLHANRSEAQAALSIALENTRTPADVVALLESTATESTCRQFKKRCI